MRITMIFLGVHIKAKYYVIFTPTRVTNKCSLIIYAPSCFFNECFLVSQWISASEMSSVQPTKGQWDLEIAFFKLTSVDIRRSCEGRTRYWLLNIFPAWQTRVHTRFLFPNTFGIFARFPGPRLFLFPHQATASYLKIQAHVMLEFNCRQTDKYGIRLKLPQQTLD